MASEASQRLCERLNSLVDEPGSDSFQSAGSRWGWSPDELDAKLIDAIETELRPEGSLEKGIGAALRANLAAVGADDGFS